MKRPLITLLLLLAMAAVAVGAAKPPTPKARASDSYRVVVGIATVHSAVLLIPTRSGKIVVILVSSSKPLGVTKRSIAVLALPRHGAATLNGVPVHIRGDVALTPPPCSAKGDMAL
jgi:hypothetical protein